VPPLRELEVRLFGALVARLWRGAAADAAASEAGGAPAYGEELRPGKAQPGSAPSTPRRSPRPRSSPSDEEAAVRRWLDGLQARTLTLSLYPTPRLITE
jgi:hypothetical protein